MAARMYRQEGSVVKKAGMGSFIETGGALVGAPAASDGYYLLSDVGAGAKPLVLIGAWYEIGPWLIGHKKGVRNIRVHRGEYGTEAMDDIYASAGAYTPGEARGLFPWIDAVTDLAKAAVSFGGGAATELGGPGGSVSEAIMELGGGASDGYSLGKQIFGGKKKSKASKRNNDSLMYVKFSGYETEGAKRIGHRKIHFKNHAVEILELMKPHVVG